MELREQIAQAIAKRGEWEPSSWLAEAEDVLEVIRPIIEERDKFKSDWLECLALAEDAKPIIDKQRAEIDAIKKQEAVGQAVLFGEGLKEISWKNGKMPPVGAKLYLAPGAQPAAIPEGWRKKVERLEAEINATKKQEPVAKVESWTNGSYSRHYKIVWIRDVDEGAMLYAMPGAQPAAVPEGRPTDA